MEKRSNIFMTLSGDVKVRYEKKILMCGGIDPYTLVQRDLSDDPKDFPDITVLDIGNYMIQSASPYTKRSFNAYKSTEAYSFFESGFVLSVKSKKTNDVAILVGRVKHSQRMNDASLKVWILANMSGNIICANCNCLAGLSETCSHAAAICFAVANIGESRDIKSVTDMLCQWNIPSFKDVSMSSVKEIHWKHPSSSQEHKTQETNFLEYCNSIMPFTDERIDQFLTKCHSDGDITALSSIVMPLERRRKTNIKDEIFLASLYNVEYKNKSRLELVEIEKSISFNVSNDEVKEISQLTVNKEKSKFYLGLRRGRVSGSNFKSCCMTNIENPSLTTINYTINPRHLENVPSIAYQTKNRKKATDQYTTKAMYDHESFVYSQCGLVINPRLPYFVGSPDGIVSCSCHGKGCVVIKCLKLLESGGSFEVLTTKPNNILNKDGNHYVLEKGHELFYQIQLQINFISLKYCDLVLWSPNDFLPMKVAPDFDFWKIAMNAASTFHEQVIMPELLGKFYTQTDSETFDDEKEFELIGLEIETLCSAEDQKISTDSETFDEGKEFELIGLEIETLCSAEDQKKPRSSGKNDGTRCLLACEHLFKRRQKSVSVEQLPQQLKSKNNISDFPKVDWFTKINATKRRQKSVSVEQLPKQLKSKNNISDFRKVDWYTKNNVRNLMKNSIEEILLTFSDHEDQLKQLYSDHIKNPKKKYMPKDLPEYIAFDIMNEKQLKAMAIFAEKELTHNLEEEEHNSTDVIFDAILPEWALAVFGKKFNLTRSEAVETIKLQSQALCIYGMGSEI